MRLWTFCLPAWVASLLAAQTVITGDYIEDRANKVYGCFCEWSGEGEHGGREAVLGWNIRSGGYRGVDLSGTRVAAVLEGRRTLSQGQNPRRSILFVDHSARPEQREAAESLVRAEFAGLLGTVVAVHAVEIEFHRDADRATLRIGNLLNVDMRKARLPEDALMGAILWYDPFIPLTGSVLGTTLNVKFAGPEFNHKWERSDPGVTGYYGTFRIPPKQPPDGDQPALR